jgi:hypothetical protein
MRIRALRLLYGANIYASNSVVRLTLVGKDALTLPIHDTPLAKRAVAAIPALARSVNEDPDASVASLVAMVALALQEAVGLQVSTGAVRWEAHHDATTVNVVFDGPEVSLGPRCGREAVILINEWMNGTGEQSLRCDRNRVERFLVEARRIAPGPTQQALLWAARERGVAASLLPRRTDAVRIGSGRWQTHLFGTSASSTSATADLMARDRWLALKMLAGAELDVVKTAPAGGPGEARVAAEDMGTPVRLMARYNTGWDETGNIYTAGEVEVAYNKLATHAGRSAVVCEAIDGDWVRVLVVDEQAVAAWLIEQPSLEELGPGNIDPELPESAESQPRAANQGRAGMSLGNASSAVAGSTLAVAGSVAAEKSYPTKPTNDCLSILPPQTQTLAIAAARCLKLGTAGVDLLLTADGASVVAGINPRCPLPWPGSAAEHAARAIVTASAPRGRRNNLKIVAVVGERHRTTTAGLLAQSLTARGETVVNAQVPQRDNVHPAVELMGAPLASVLIVEGTLESLRDHGLGVEHCDLAVLSDAPDDRDVPPGLVSPLKLLMQSARRTLIVDDGRQPRDSTLTFVSKDGGSPSFDAHREAGGDVVIRDADDVLRYHHGDGRVVPLEMQASPATQQESELFALVASYLLLGTPTQPGEA